MDQPESLDKQVDHIEQEARMLLPGIQALFGFQLIAVFNQRFDQVLSRTEQHIHLIALCLVAVAVVLVMGPAASCRACSLSFRMAREWIWLTRDSLTSRITAISPRLSPR